MKISIENIDIFWDFEDCFNYAKELLKINTLIQVTYKFNNVTIDIFQSSELDSTYKAYLNYLRS